MTKSVLIIDFGSQYTHLIGRKIRELGIYAEIYPPKYLNNVTNILNHSVLILSGGPDSVLNKNSPSIDIPLHQIPIPILGICLGMQLLCECSEEGNQKGLGLVPAKVLHLNDASRGKLKIPHMGWNIVRPITHENVFSGLEDEARFYFVHSYHVNCFNPVDVLATCEYGYEFTCAVRCNNIWGAQFHPEKSHRFGIQFLKNFLKETGHA